MRRCIFLRRWLLVVTAFMAFAGYRWGATWLLVDLDAGLLFYLRDGRVH